MLSLLRVVVVVIGVEFSHVCFHAPELTPPPSLVLLCAFVCFKFVWLSLIQFTDYAKCSALPTTWSIELVLSLPRLCCACFFTGNGLSFVMRGTIALFLVYFPGSRWVWLRTVSSLCVHRVEISPCLQKRTRFRCRIITNAINDSFWLTG